jgi:hypothetical protein
MLLDGAKAWRRLPFDFIRILRMGRLRGVQRKRQLLLCFHQDEFAVKNRNCDVCPPTAMFRSRLRYRFIPTKEFADLDSVSWWVHMRTE